MKVLNLKINPTNIWSNYFSNIWCIGTHFYYICLLLTTLKCWHSFCLIFISLSHYLSFSLSFTHTDTNTHTHTQARTHTHTHTHLNTRKWRNGIKLWHCFPNRDSTAFVSNVGISKGCLKKERKRLNGMEQFFTISWWWKGILN